SWSVTSKTSGRFRSVTGWEVLIGGLAGRGEVWLCSFNRWRGRGQAMMGTRVTRSGQMELVFISATPGLEGVLAGEARALGDVPPVPGGVEVRGAPGLHRRANLLLRTASRVLLRLATVPADSPRALETGLRGVDLSPYRGALGAVLAGADAVRSRLS